MKYEPFLEMSRKKLFSSENIQYTFSDFCETKSYQQGLRNFEMWL